MLFPVWMLEHLVTVSLVFLFGQQEKGEPVV